MLQHAFERWDCVRVEFETAAGNEQAGKVIARIGAIKEGILRKHMLIQGEPQESVYFSIIDTEWSEIKELLLTKLDRSLS